MNVHTYFHSRGTRHWVQWYSVHTALCFSHVQQRSHSGHWEQERPPLCETMTHIPPPPRVGSFISMAYTQHRMNWQLLMSLSKDTWHVRWTKLPKFWNIGGWNWITIPAIQSVVLSHNHLPVSHSQHCPVHCRFLTIPSRTCNKPGKTYQTE